MNLFQTQWSFAIGRILFALRNIGDAHHDILAIAKPLLVVLDVIARHGGNHFGAFTTHCHIAANLGNGNARLLHITEGPHAP